MLDFLVTPFIVFMVVLTATCTSMNESDSKEETVAAEVVEPPELW